jgi:general secretion pathway protein G
MQASRGFTVLELLVVLAAMALLLSLVAPNYLGKLKTAEEVTLRHNLQATREVIDQFHADQGRFPSSLQELVSSNYLRQLPVDPMTQRNDTWTLVPAGDGQKGIKDIRSGAPGESKQGGAYADW